MIYSIFLLNSDGRATLIGEAPTLADAINCADAALSKAPSTSYSIELGDEGKSSVVKVVS